MPRLLLTSLVLLTACGEGGLVTWNLGAVFWTGAVLVVLGAVALVLWQRSEAAAAFRAVQQFRKVIRARDPKATVIFMDDLAMDRAPGRRQAFLEHFSRYVRRASRRAEVFADYLDRRSKLLGILDGIDWRMSAKERNLLASSMDAYISGMKDYYVYLQDGGYHAAADAVRPIIAQHQINVSYLRAESAAHLAAIRPRFEAILPLLSQASEPFFSSEILQRQRHILDEFARLERLTTVEDRAAALSQILPLIFKVRQQAEQEWVERQQLSLYLWRCVYESLYQLVSRLLRGLGERAELSLELRSRTLDVRRDAVLVVDVHNAGPGSAQNVILELMIDEGVYFAQRPRHTVGQLLRGQSARLELLVTPRVSDRFRVRFQVTYNDLERRGQVLEYADMIELRSEADETFIPLYPNPYVVGRPLRDADIFIGREEVFAHLGKMLDSATRGELMIAIGQRRMGKTSVLRRLRQRVESIRYVAVLVDLQGLLATDEVAFLREMMVVIQDELDDLGISVVPLTRSELQPEPMVNFRQVFLRRVLRALDGRRLLIMIDEYEIIEEYVNKGVLTPRFILGVRDLIQEKSIRLLFSGTNYLDALTRDTWHILLSRAQYLHVGHFSSEQVAELFVRPTEGYVEIDSLALEKAYHLTGGHPHFSQLLARELVETRNKGKSKYLTIQDIHQAADLVVDKGQLHIVYIWNEAMRTERLLMLTVRELLDREGAASLEAVTRFIENHQLEAIGLEAAVGSLERKEILALRDGSLFFRMELLVKWLRKTQSLELLSLTEVQ